MSSTMEDYYEKITRILLKILGIWPYQDPKWARIQGIIIISLYMSFLFAQVFLYLSLILLFKEYYHIYYMYILVIPLSFLVRRVYHA